MSRLLAVIIVVLTAASPALGGAFYNSPQALGTECKRAVAVMDRVQTGTFERDDPNDTAAIGICGAYCPDRRSSTSI